MKMKRALLLLFTISLVVVAVAMTEELPEMIFASGGNIIYVGGTHITEDSTICVVNLQIPFIEGLTKAGFESYINSLIKSDVEGYRKEIQEMAADAYEASKSDEWPFRIFDVYVVYTAYLSNGILSIDMIFSEFTGGAHPNAARRTYNIDVRGNHLVSLKSLFPSEDFENRLNELLIGQINEREDLWPEEFKGVQPDQGFYLNAGRLYIYFQPYEIGPWASGMPEFDFLLSDLL
jgi:hypothetical protein